MAQFFQTAGNFFTTIYNYIKSLVRGMLAIPQMLDNVGDFLNECLAFVPGEIVMFVLVIVFLCVLFHVIGR